MAVTAKDINALLNRINGSSVKDIQAQSAQSSIKPLISVSNGGTAGTLHSTYGAVPNVTVGSGLLTSTGTGSAGWTTSGTGTTIGTGPSGMWTNTTGTGYTIGTPGTQINQSGKVHIQGENADLVIGDKSMRAWMEKVEERLNILTPNPDMEKDWDDLRKLGERYRKLEKKCQEKAAMWEKLKSMPRPDVP